jgi:hypothetical protein
MATAVFREGTASQVAEKVLVSVIPNEARNLLFAKFSGKSRFLGHKPPSE